MNREEILQKANLPEEGAYYTPIIKELTHQEIKRARIKYRVKYVLKILNYLLLLVVGASFVYPFIWMFSMSLRTIAEANLFSPNLIVTNPQWGNYLEAWKRAKFSKYLGNSIMYAVLVLGLQYFFIIPIAYALARMEFKGRKTLFIIKQIGMMLPMEATLIPVYFLYARIGLVDTWTGLILPSLFSMFGIYMFMNHFKTVPNEIVESAKLDKAKNRTIMIRIMVPYILPTFITHFILTFISNWNSYYWVLVMTSSERLKTLPVAITGLLRAEGITQPWHLAMAGNILQLAPILLMYIFGNQQVKRAMIGGRKIKFAGSRNKKSLFKRIKEKIAKSKTQITYVERKE